ncbi:MAG: V-type ATPase subunit [Candidatus Hydrogenedentota bacterium]
MTAQIETVHEHIVYMVARVHGMKSRLLSRDELEDLLDQQDVEAVIEVLLTSEYQEEMARALATHSGANAIEEAVSRHVLLAFQQLLDTSGPRYRPYAALFLARWDLMTVKQLLRRRFAQDHGVYSRDLPMPGPTLGVPLIKHLSELDSLEALIQGLVAWNRELCACLWGVHSTDGTEGELRVLEDALDRTYLVENVRSLAGNPDLNAQLLRNVLRLSIDGINLRILLHDKAHQDAHEDWLLPEGTMSKRVAAKMMAAEDVESAMVLLESTPYRELVEGLYMFLQTGRFSPLERMFEQQLAKELRRMARRHGMTLAPLMYYAWLKYNEVVNLRLIARGGTRHLPRGRIREEMMYG